MFTKILTSSLLFLIAIGGFFVSIDIDTSTIGSSIAITSISEVSAAPEGPTTEAESKWLNDAIQAVNAVLAVITVIISPVIIFAGWLMSPDWTTGDLFGLREPMHNMWVIVSNIVYFIYAILLIIIALATIFGKENFSYKTMIPRLALGILMVPFTWWFVQWTISLATVVTASVVNIPMETLHDQYPSSNPILNEKIIPGTFTISSLTSSGTVHEKTDCSTNKTACLSVQDILNHDGGMYNTLLIYAYNVFKIQDYKDITSIRGKFSTAGQLLNNIVISAVMLLVFGLLVMALIAMLLLRAIKLWMYAIFSPIFTLHFVAGKELFGNSTEGFDIKEFIGLCFVPAIVGLTLSFGLMIVSIVQIPSQGPSSGSNTCNLATMNSLTRNDADGSYSGGCVMARLMGTTSNTIRRGILNGTTDTQTGVITDVVSIAGMNIVFKSNSTNISKSAEDASAVNGAFSTAGGIFGTIIIDIIALVFIWMAFMAAKGVTKAVNAAVEPFEAMGKKIGGMAMSAPKYIPIPGTGGQSAASLQRTAELASNKFDTIKREKAETQAGKLVPWATEGIVNAKDVEKMKQAADSIKNASLETKFDTMSKVTGEIQRERKDTRANFTEIQQNLKGLFSNINDEDLRKLFLRKGIADKKEQDSLIKFYKGVDMDENERVKARNANIKFAGNSSGSNQTTGGATTGTRYTATVLTNDKERMQVTIENMKFDTKLDGSNIKALSDTEKTNITEIMKKVTEEEFKEKFSGLSEDAVKNIIEELKKQGGVFKA